MSAYFNRRFISIVLGLIFWLTLTGSGNEVLKEIYDQVDTFAQDFGIYDVVGIQGTSEEEQQYQSFSNVQRKLEEEEQLLLRTITEHCLPKLVCELFSKQLKSQLTEGEISLMSLIGVTTLHPSGPTKYHYAAHMGQLIRGVEGSGCHDFFPKCPFSGDDVRHIAKKININ